MFCFEVAVAAPLNETLTYGPPEDHILDVQPGVRVLVPLGNRLVTGYVLATIEEPGSTDFELKNIVEILDDVPLFPASLVPFFRWIANYYHYPPGEVIRTALPAGLTTSSGRKITVSEDARQQLLELHERDKKTLGSWFDKLVELDEISPNMVRKLWQSRTRQRLIQKLADEGIVRIEAVLLEQNVKPKTATYVRLTKEFQKLNDSNEFSSLGKAERRVVDLLTALTTDSGQDFVERPLITRQYKGASSVLHRMQDKGLLVQEEHRVYRDPFGSRPPFFPEPLQLSLQQESVLQQLDPVLKNPKFQTFLLFGVTGSGKTEVYLQAAKQVVDHGRTVLVLVPEIALASQLEAHFYSRFGDTLAVLHSGLSAGERLDQWQRIQKGEVLVVLGARSAVFAPLENLGLVVVDEEHEGAYKQDSGLCYNGRDLAVLRARYAECPIVLGSATPTVVSYYHCKNDRYQLLSMDKRLYDREMPVVEVVDLSRRERSRPDLFFTDPLISEIRKNLETNQQTLLFVNRRGFASFVMCRDCGHVLECRNCKVSLTKHRQKNKLLCHYCGYNLSPNIICPSCGSSKMGEMGLGSERIEEEVRQHFPEARVARLDSDIASSNKTYLKTLSLVRERKIDILVGTQMIAKGLHFPHVTLVGVIWADSGLAMPDYKASERTFQLLSQVTGRAGRGEHAGRVIIQTHQPEHYAVLCARKHDYITMYNQEIHLRKSLGYPPFTRLINIRFKGENEKKVEQSAEATGRFLREKAAASSLSADILGPAAAPLARIRNKSRWQLLLKAEIPRSLHYLCELLLVEKSRLLKPGVQMRLDIDPENMM